MNIVHLVVVKNSFYNSESGRTIQKSAHFSLILGTKNLVNIGTQQSKTKKKKDDLNKHKDDELEVDLISTIKAYLSQIKADRKKKTLKPLKYDKNLGKFVHRSTSDMQLTKVDIALDRHNYAVINKSIMDNEFLSENRFSRNIVSTVEIRNFTQLRQKILWYNSKIPAPAINDILPTSRR